MTPLAPVESSLLIPVEASIATPQPALQAPVKPRSTRYQSLDLWRGAACLMLVFYHTTFFVPAELRLWDPSSWTIADVVVKIATTLWIGVPMFFVVSGYCISASVDALTRGPYSLKTYFTRRIRRIYPPLWIAFLWAIGVTLAISVFFPRFHEVCRPLPRLENWSIWNWLGNFTATESWRHHATGGESDYLMNNTWTLCYEEQFYAVVGVLLLVASRRFVAASLGLCVVTLACRHIARWHGLEQAGWFFDGHWLLFAAGIFLHYQLTKATRAGWWAILGLFVVGMIYAVVDRRLMAGDERATHFDEYVFVSCAFAIALIVLRRWDAALMNAKPLKPLQWCGTRSYSIYLTHFPVVVTLSCVLMLAGLATPTQWLLVTLPLCVAASMALGWMFHVLVERHFLNAPAFDGNGR